MRNRTRIAPAATAIACSGIASLLTSAALADMGATEGKSTTPAREIAIGDITPSLKAVRASVASGGVGLRNRASGAIEISGVSGKAKSAYLYWAVISNGKPPAKAAKPTIQKVGPSAGRPRALSGKIIGSGASPCWGGTQISVYKAAVPVSVVKGNGTYLVQVPPKSAGSFSGLSPWADMKLPHWEGASLVVIGGGSGTVEIFDNGLAGKTAVGYSESISYTLKSAQSSSASTVVLHNIGADGQRNEGGADSSISSEYTMINGSYVAGPNSLATDSDWNGHDGGPVAQLWDTSQHEIASIVSGGDLSVYIDNKNDCLTPVANVLYYR